MSHENTHTQSEVKPHEDYRLDYNHLNPRPIGKGEFGEVHLCAHKKTGKKVAVKVIPKVKGSLGCPEHEGAEFEIDAYVAIQQHTSGTHVVQLLDRYENDQETALILEYCEGGELYTRAIQLNQELVGRHKNMKKREKIVRQFFRQILIGVGCIHRAGYGHRDLKCENILLDKEGNIKITDLGLAAPSTIGCTNPAGSVFYMAPETFSSFYCPQAADVWSLGVILYILVDGRMPFKEPTAKRFGAVYLSEEEVQRNKTACAHTTQYFNNPALFFHNTSKAFASSTPTHTPLTTRQMLAHPQGPPMHTTTAPTESGLKGHPGDSAAGHKTRSRNNSRTLSFLKDGHSKETFPPISRNVSFSMSLSRSNTNSSGSGNDLTRPAFPCIGVGDSLTHSSDDSYAEMLKHERAEGTTTSTPTTTHTTPLTTPSTTPTPLLNSLIAASLTQAQAAGMNGHANPQRPSAPNTPHTGTNTATTSANSTPSVDPVAHASSSWVETASTYTVTPPVSPSRMLKRRPTNEKGVHVGVNPTPLPAALVKLSELSIRSVKKEKEGEEKEEKKEKGVEEREREKPRTVADKVRARINTAVCSHELKSLLYGIFCFDVEKRLTLEDVANHDWVTEGGKFPLYLEEGTRPIPRKVDKAVVEKLAAYGLSKEGFYREMERSHLQFPARNLCAYKLLDEERMKRSFSLNNLRSTSSLPLDRIANSVSPLEEYFSAHPYFVEDLPDGNVPATEPTPTPTWQPHYFTKTTTGPLNNTTINSTANTHTAAGFHTAHGAHAGHPLGSLGLMKSSAVGKLSRTVQASAKPPAGKNQSASVRAQKYLLRSSGSTPNLFPDRVPAKFGNVTPSSRFTPNPNPTPTPAGHLLHPQPTPSGTESSLLSSWGPNQPSRLHGRFKTTTPPHSSALTQPVASKEAQAPAVRGVEKVQATGSSFYFDADGEYEYGDSLATRFYQAPCSQSQGDLAGRKKDIGGLCTSTGSQDRGSEGEKESVGLISADPHTIRALMNTPSPSPLSAGTRPPAPLPRQAYAGPLKSGSSGSSAEEKCESLTSSTESERISSAKPGYPRSSITPPPGGYASPRTPPPITHPSGLTGSFSHSAINSLSGSTKAVPMKLYERACRTRTPQVSPASKRCGNTHTMFNALYTVETSKIHKVSVLPVTILTALVWVYCLGLGLVVLWGEKFLSV